jgi:hypothetical protein
LSRARCPELPLLVLHVVHENKHLSLKQSIARRVARAPISQRSGPQDISVSGSAPVLPGMSDILVQTCSSAISACYRQCGAQTAVELCCLAVRILASNSSLTSQLQGSAVASACAVKQMACERQTSGNARVVRDVRCSRR